MRRLWFVPPPNFGSLTAYGADSILNMYKVYDGINMNLKFEANVQKFYQIS